MSTPNKRSPLYIAVWRWHFYAGIFVIPFMLLLSVTGGIYLFKTEFEQWWYRDLLTVSPQGARIPAERIVSSVVAANPNFSLVGYSPASSDSSTVRVILTPRKASAATPKGGGHESHDAGGGGGGGGDDDPFQTRAREFYVNPYNGQVLGSLTTGDRIMQTVRNIHGKLLSGGIGEIVIETAAGWMAMLLVSGLYLFWPRQGGGVWGTLLPRLRSGQRLFWRDMHSVPAFYTTVFLVVILVTGMPWTIVAGAGIKQASGSARGGPPGARADRFHSQPVASQSGSVQDWFSSFPEATGAKLRSIPPAKPGQISLGHVTVIAEASGLAHPFQIALPRGPHGVYSVRTLPRDPRQTAFLHVDQYSGKVLGDVRFDAMKPMAQAVSMGIALHEGRLFGFWNQMLGVLACLGAFTLSGSAAVLWWKRRPEGRLGAPRMVNSFRMPQGVVALSGVMALIFPVAGASLILVLAFDRYLLPRIPRLHRILAN